MVLTNSEIQRRELGVIAKLAALPESLKNRDTEWGRAFWDRIDKMAGTDANGTNELQ